MNRIVLIGNGFDLAHGLKTRYEDFINWYWDYRVNGFVSNRTNTSTDCLCVFECLTQETWNSFCYNLPRFFNKLSGKEVVESILKDKDRYKVSFSPFFKNICKSIETNGWVDIETEYYKLLEHFSLDNYTAKEIEKLNKQLQYLQKLLTDYLTIINQQDIPVIESIRKKIYEPIKKFDISIESTKILAEHIVWCKKQDKNVWDLKLYNYGINPITSGVIHDVE